MTDGGFGPGMGAFTVFLLLAVALWLLMRNMNARLRRMSYAERAGSSGAGAADGPGTDSGDGVQGDGGGPEVGGEGQDRQ